TRLLLLFTIFTVACGGSTTPPVPTQAQAVPKNQPTVLRFIASSPFARLNEKIEAFNRDPRNKGTVQMQNVGSIDLMRKLRDEPQQIDAVGSSDTLFLTLSGNYSMVKSRQSAMHSPPVLGVKRPKAAALNWINRDVTSQMILDAVRTKQLNY